MTIGSRDGFGKFPFGRPNTIRDMRPATDGHAKGIIVGVYPSAFHIGWRRPAYLGDDRVGSMAVDVEPTVFWDGSDPTPKGEYTEWPDRVGFIAGDVEGRHGRLFKGMNAPTGITLGMEYLSYLQWTPDRTAFTDVCPVFLAKYSSGRRSSGTRAGGDAIREVYDPVARDLGYEPASLPSRPLPTAFPALAAETFSDHIRHSLEQADAPVVVTLGDEALQALALVPELEPAPTGHSLAEIYDQGMYGCPGTLRVNGTTVKWLPLIHPGLIKGSSPTRGGRDYAGAHRAWQQEPYRCF